jgi:hypothetical protein
MIDIKAGVVFEVLTDEMQEAMRVVQAVWGRMSCPRPAITSAHDGHHVDGSKHYMDQALDFRLRNVPMAAREPAIQAVQAELGSLYTVLHEDVGTPNEHMHVQFDQQRGGGRGR